MTDSRSRKFGDQGRPTVIFSIQNSSQNLFKGYMNQQAAQAQLHYCCVPPTSKRALEIWGEMRTTAEGRGRVVSKGSEDPLFILPPHDQPLSPRGW